MSKPQIRSPSATRASLPPPLPEYQLEAEEEPGGCRLILKATKAFSLFPPSAPAARCSSHLAVHLPRDANLVDSLGDEIHNILIPNPE